MFPEAQREKQGWTFCCKLETPTIQLFFYTHWPKPWTWQLPGSTALSWDGSVVYLAKCPIESALLEKRAKTSIPKTTFMEERISVQKGNISDLRLKYGYAEHKETSKLGQNWTGSCMEKVTWYSSENVFIFQLKDD